MGDLLVSLFDKYLVNMETYYINYSNFNFTKNKMYS